ncbi:hypothetical protein BVRB_9g224560 isoform B [Beta vulgaris subsp. vulgaris]|uniref:Uncharacterized protein n=2 Tax=Beta vulgaris subsp. vulgaris TaxID=3555 RepID=A0A0J8B6B3_BETVV|nr:wax ester synthase/diacylglycerol acyltransferase 8-like [Beta vulgaris subsp. vulgaris]KMS96516.1 hypothetical protein BVRB_9g224560 isoform B [Beta vulgaris subsp. vulgaris]
MQSSRDEPVSPAGRLFLQSKTELIINCSIGFKNPLEPEAMKTYVANSLFMKHPRFCSLLVVDAKGREFWRKTKINIDNHVIIHPKNPSLECESEEECEDKINAILADYAVSSPLSMEKPLWELHIISELKCMIFRFHHAMGDGISLMSLFLATCKRLCDGKDAVSDVNVSENKKGEIKKRKGKGNPFIGILKVIWWTILSVMEVIGRSLWVRDKKTAISGGDGVELWPRMVATAKFTLEDMKTVKRTIPHATINDVLFGVISFGFSKYLESRSSQGLQEGQQITGLATVNLRKQPGLQEVSKLMDENCSRWGNKFGFMILPVYYHNTKDADPLKFVKRAKVMIDRKKQSLGAHFSYYAGKFTMSLLGPKAASMSNHKILCNTTFVISNIVGTQEESTFAGNPMTYITATTTSLPTAVMMHMVSYAGKASMQISVAKEIIPDPRFLAQCFQDALLEMKTAAQPATVDDVC